MAKKVKSVHVARFIVDGDVLKLDRHFPSDRDAIEGAEQDELGKDFVVLHVHSFDTGDKSKSKANKPGEKKPGDNPTL